MIAKRYLVTNDPGYRRRLSPRSAETLAVQGDALADAEMAALASDPDLEAILDLRRADERAKDPEALVAGLESWRRCSPTSRDEELPLVDRSSTPTTRHVTAGDRPDAPLIVSLAAS